MLHASLFVELEEEHVHSTGAEQQLPLELPLPVKSLHPDSLGLPGL